MATPPTITDFRPLYPEFDAVADPVVTAALAEAALFSDDTWGDAYATAVMLLAAHNLTRSAQQNGGGAIRSVSLGSIAITYADSVSNSEALASTSYGERYVKLRRVYASGGPLVA